MNLNKQKANDACRNQVCDCCLKSIATDKLKIDFDNLSYYFYVCRECGDLEPKKFMKKLESTKKNSGKLE